MVKYREHCFNCDGHGVISDYGPVGDDFYGPKECPECNGSGWITTVDPGLISIEEWNASRMPKEVEATTGIACPECGEELIYPQPNVFLMSDPVKRAVSCPTCKYSTTVLA